MKSRKNKNDGMKGKERLLEKRKGIRGVSKGRATENNQVLYACTNILN